MGKSLVIVESPAKAKTINKYLGTAFSVKSSVGHIRDLPVSGSGESREKPAKAVGKAATPEEKKARARKQLFARMGVNPENGWEAHYEILPGKEKVVSELKKLAQDADTIYLATDLDREGEAIAWHLAETIGGDPSKYRRVVFNEITKKAIQEAFEHPGSLDIDRVNAQQARRFLDRVVGYMVSPLLWAKIARGLSAGRVQSVAAKLIVEREREIRAFIPEEYWEVFAALSGASGATRFGVSRYQGEAFRPASEAQTTQHLESLRKQGYRVDKREDKPTRSRPSAPFITSTLQQAASSRLGFSVKKTMTLAQRLYEAGHITYMRTDSTNLSQDAVQSARALIEKRYGAKYLPEAPRVYSNKEGAQEAHEAIRPSDANRSGEDIDGLERDAQRLYDLIWRQFVACQMADAEFLSTSLVVVSGEYELRTRGRVELFDGFQRVLQQAKSDDDVILPDLKVGETLVLNALEPKQHFTKPSPRYSEATLVRELEKRGIGRPSTYAAIISTIQERGYVRLENRRFYAEKMGDIVTERLGESFSDLMDYGFTAKMEQELDEVATGKSNWKSVLDKFYAGFRGQLQVAEVSGSGMRENQPTMTAIPCPTCGRSMQIRTASTGVFLGCSGYALPPKERCKTTINLVSADEFAALDEDDEEESRRLRKKRRCDLCSSAMDSYVIDERRKIHVCGNNPDCTGHALEEGTFKLKGYEGPSLECDKCGEQMQLKTGRFGKFFGCTNPQCKNTRKLLRNGEAAPPKIEPVAMPELRCVKVNDHYVLRDGAAGLFLAASQFPRNRETRAPLLQELLPYRDKIDSKYHYLFDAPLTDGNGNPAIVRFSRKSKEHYLTTEVDGKTTGWTAHYDGGRWAVSTKS